MVFRFSRRAVDRFGPHQSEDAAVFGIHRHDGMQEYPDILAVAHGPEASFTAGVGREIEFGGIGHRQHMPAGRAARRQMPGPDQHLVTGDRGVIEQAGEPAGLVTVVGQRVQAHGLLALHRGQQRIAGRGTAPVAKPAALRIAHDNRSPCCGKGSESWFGWLEKRGNESNDSCRS